MLLRCVLALSGTTPLAAQVPMRWVVAPAPTVRIGTGDTDTTGLLSAVTGATRLADGSVLLGDVGPFALLHFDRTGRFVRRFRPERQRPGRDRLSGRDVPLRRPPADERHRWVTGHRVHARGRGRA